MANSTIKYYPVANGDNALITLEDGLTIMVDCKIRDCQDDTIFDVKADLLNSLKKRDNNPFVDVFILTHGDKDHCLGFEKHFYHGDPKKYGDKNRKEGEIIVDEMWFSPMIAERHTNPDEDTYQQEAERRLELHRNKNSDRDLPGNRIRIVGYDLKKLYTDLNHLRSVPGDEVSIFNARTQATFSVFIHSPFKEHLISDEKSKNSASIVFQARFKQYSYSTTFSGLAMFGGDSDHESWRIILEKTKKYGNDVSKKALDYDLFLAPHHCSWTFFNETPQGDHKTPKATSLAVLDYKRSSAKVVASSKEILNNDDDPPHFEAKKEYEKKVGSDKFLNTDTYLKKGKTPQPIIFEITPQGPMVAKVKEGSSTAVGAAGLSVLKEPSSYGAK